ncbi:hypothetical protein BHE74_00040333 [Ensete ventricosum]|uniref:Uncharacterized protein n=1 Tax=Ensete ventricosum TaxID=4639 RepID=A0A444GEK2_ENSVE|nr:hypothetical protein B296_00030612 [Ensete ventricosum]RWW33303.1 hypothetical protein GW17_00001991 [Ensete ventricosum]RWW53198.1 hypothetical protein BHE74_00040333 [Ensete ventricosum]RZR80196.1 hypothetical protein BHM03_00006143 [Ensete ventricosum]
MDRAAVTSGPAMDMPIMHDSDRYELVKDIGSGNFGIARLMRDKQTKELVAVKYIERGEKRITIPEIRNHEWFLKNLPADLMDDNTMSNQYEEPDEPMQSIDEIMQILAEATIPAAGTQGLNQYLTDSLDIDDDDMEDLDSDPDLDIDSSGEMVYAM